MPTLLRAELRGTLLLLLCVLAPATALLPAQQLVWDINTSARSYASRPQPGVASQGVAFFPASGRDTGEELHVSNGTAGGSRLVAEIRPGSSGADIEWLTPRTSSTGVFFSADDGQSGAELWTSDGTATGTRRVADINPGSADSSPSDMLVLPNGTVVFAADDGVFGRELWRTDPTQGAVMIKDLLSGPPGSEPRDLVRLGQRFVFTAMAPSGLRRAVYSSDGTAAGTQPVYLPDAFVHQPSELTTFGGKVYFTGNERFTGVELYETDGTPTGTRLAFELFPGGGSGSPRHVQVLPTSGGDRLVMVGRDRVTERLWISDGTQAGTRFVDFTAAGVRSPRTITVAHDRIYFAGSGVTGLEPWVSDGTQAGTRAIADVEPGSAASFPGDFTAVTINGRRVVTFAAQTRALGRELYVHDSNGVRRLSDSLPGPQPGYQGAIVALPGRLLYSGYDPTASIELFASDGTANGTRLLADLASSRPGETNGSSPRFLNELPNGDQLWTANHAITSRSLWRTNGTANGAFRLTPASVQPGSSLVSAVLGNRVIFTASDPQHGFEPWITDGSPAGTKLLVDIIPGSTGSRPGVFSGIVRLGNAVYFTAGARLWRTDGTAAGTRQVVTSGTIPQDPSALTLAGGRLFFTANSTAGRELWTSDGTSAGTAMVADLAPGTASALNLSTQLTAIGNRVFFAAMTPAGREPWSSDGTSAGTRIVFDLDPSGSSSPRNFVAVGNRVYFSASVPQSGIEVWSTDLAGTAIPRVHEVLRGPASSGPRELVATEHGLMFTAVTSAGSSNTALFVISATVTNPVRLTAPLRVGQVWQIPDSKVVLFTAQEPATGRELWSTLGTPASARRVADLNPGAGWSSPFSYSPLRREVLMSADDGQHGSEIFAVDRAVLEAGFVGSYGTACRGALTLTATGRPEPGNSLFSLDVRGARAAAPLALIVGIARANLAVAGCTLLVQPAGSAVLPTTSSGGGTATILLPLPPNPSTIGVTLHSQVFGAAGTLLEASAGLEFLIGR